MREFLERIIGPFFLPVFRERGYALRDVETAIWRKSIQHRLRVGRFRWRDRAKLFTHFFKRNRCFIPPSGKVTHCSASRKTSSADPSGCHTERDGVTLLVWRSLENTDHYWTGLVPTNVEPNRYIRKTTTTTTTTTIGPPTLELS